jgi:hypothetical protein
MTVFVTIRAFQDRFFRTCPFHFSLFSRQIGDAWNGFQAPRIRSEPLEHLPTFPSFSEFMPLPDFNESDCEIPAILPSESEFSRSLQECYDFLSPFAIFLPSAVAQIWDEFSQIDTIAQNTPVSRAIEDLIDTIHPIARDVCVSESKLLRLDGLLNLQQYKVRILTAPKIATDFFPVPVFQDSNRGIVKEELCQ